MYISLSSVPHFLFVFKNQFILCLALWKVIQVEIVGCHIHQPFPSCGGDCPNVVFASQGELFEENLEGWVKKLISIYPKERNYSKPSMVKTR